MSGISRRAMGKLIFAVSASTLTSKRAAGDEPDPLAEFLSKQEPGLSPEERERLKKNVTNLEPSLESIRGFPIANAVAPAFCFRALKSR